MAEEVKNSIVISKKNSGFPDYLDFDKLRREGIDYLGRLGGKIWTDHNVHDPGITMLEILCYALLDLGYRTNLPVEDIFARNPKDKTTDDNFFTPGRILACNPLTITDFRKLLIDIEGVKNAWLEIATDQQDMCLPPGQPDNGSGSVLSDPGQDKCIEYLNGLYHVYIDLEKNVQKEYPVESERQEYVNKIRDRIKDALMKHRNLCEDFVDIYFLCKLETGVCAEIELEDNADVEKVYLSLVEKLRDFFSPSPRFYTLQQLLDRHKPIDEIFAGRPYNITESHGFVDTVEFEQLTLRREIHLSDVYNVIFSIEGIRSVKRLVLQVCKDNIATPVKGWKFHIPENHVPEFSMSCSGFTFTRNEMPVFINFKKYEGLIEINFTHNGKILYQHPLPYLDSEIQNGVYRKDLGDYYSIQNEFPRVYGIAEGGLPGSASSMRKAQAYQLKAWLLFFDQLLTNYLSQLQNIRALFALSSPKNKSDNHTYFTSQLNTVPDLQKLLRFNISDDNKNPLGTEGSLLVVPVDKTKLLALKEQDKLKTIDLEKVTAYEFTTVTDKDIAISQVKNDLYYEQYQCEYVAKTDDCVFYYIITSSGDIALISKKYFKDIPAARENAASVKYIGTFDENYRSFTNGVKFSFHIELNLLSFSKYLQLIVEDKDLFIQRRQVFLDHLLARFAEQFTDYAQLSFGFYNDQQLKVSDIRKKEAFLSHYDDLSSNRGRAYDYLMNNWNNDNQSGFEKKIKAISGIDNWNRHSLCNFIVDKYEEQFAVNLKIAGTTYFSTSSDFDSKEEALTSAQALFSAMRTRSNYSALLVPHDMEYALRIMYMEDRQAVYPARFISEEDALKVAGNLSGLFIEKSPAQSVFESSYQYIPILKDSGENIVRRSIEVYNSAAEASSEALKTIKKIDDRKKWVYPDKDPSIGHLFYDIHNTAELSFINTDAFKIDIDNTIIGKPDKFTFDLLDKDNNFKFRSVKEFESTSQARTNAHQLLALMAGKSNAEIFHDDSTGKYFLRIVYKEDVQAVSVIESNSNKEAEDLSEKIVAIVREHQFKAIILESPNKWKFSYQLGYDKTNMHDFHSSAEYADLEEANKGATKFYEVIPSLSLNESGKELFLVPPKNKSGISTVQWIPSSSGNYSTKVKESVQKLLEEQQEIRRLSANASPEVFSNSVDKNEVSRQGLYVYRLIDKDRVPAFFSRTFADKSSAEVEIKSIIKQFGKRVNYLQLCMGGDIISEIRHLVNKIASYRYQLKSRNHVYKSGSNAGKSLVLFESAKSYASRIEAEEAFMHAYLEIIELASTKKNYGTKISLVEIPDDTENRSPINETIVFVPKETLEDLGATPDLAVEALIKLSLTYPIRLVLKNSGKFKELFSCEKVEEEKGDFIDCRKVKDEFVYYFTYPADNPGSEKWQSIKYFEKADEAWAEFEFFLILLLYPGNYYIDCDRCFKDSVQYRIFIREVLAESAARFASKEEAWGKEGVQKFICVSQTEDAFHNYLSKENCCYSFYTACNNGLVYHPCKYDLPQTRDDVMLKLYQGIKTLFKKKSWQADMSGGELNLLNEVGEPFAVAMVNDNDQGCISDRIAALTAFIYADQLYSEQDDRFILRDTNNEILVSSGKSAHTLSTWKDMLRDFICYYPIVRSTDEKSGKNIYCIEIKLPGFNNCSDETAEEKPCGCSDKTPGDTSPCFIAWKGRCCYDTCDEAEQAYVEILKLLVNFDYYQPVFDCICGYYGINIQFSRISAIRDPNINYYLGDLNIRNFVNSELIAANPQCYPSSELACEAVSRSKKLINSEGLHIVEHILLRPRCIPEDCRCPQYNNRCNYERACEQEWFVDDGDPCTEEKKICFVPGADPYSFIATVVLPAWPERFRKPENRRLLENILYHEAPAHVLLRILWLSPHDFCCFEGKHKNWNRWLAGKKTCLDDFTVCDFLEFLFDHNYECLDNCNVCLPCDDNKVQPNPCFEDASTVGSENLFLAQVNRLFCWTDQQCSDYNFIDCEGSGQVPEDDPILLLRVSNRMKKIAEEEHTEAMKATKEKKPSIVAKYIESPVAKTPAKRKSQVVNSRMNKYRAGAATVQEKTKNTPEVEKVQSFLVDPEPGFDRLSKLVDEIIKGQNPKAAGTGKMTKSQSWQLLESSICYYLDKHCFNGKDMRKIMEVKKVFDKLRKSGLTLKRLYEYWDLKELMSYELALDGEKIKSLFNTK